MLSVGGRRISTVEPSGLGQCLAGLRVVVCDGDYRINSVSRRSQRADGVGGGGITGQEQGLAAAAAEVLRAAIAVPTGFLHPGFAAKLLEGGGCFPDFAQPAVLYVGEMQSRNNLSGVARKGV